jgi:hypothetical protein
VSAPRRYEPLDTEQSSPIVIDSRGWTQTNWRHAGSGLWQITQSLIDHVVAYAQGPATEDATSAVVEEAAHVEAEARALGPFLAPDDSELARTGRVLENLKDILRSGHEATPGAALLTDYRQDWYSPN